jgi:ABC-type dipeptide/oligopeptide/nickel transport system ATPase subunit
MGMSRATELVFQQKRKPMLDPWTSQRVRFPLNYLARHLKHLDISPDQVTIAGFFLGMTALPLIWTRHYALALAAILINRILDGVDGALARLLTISPSVLVLDEPTSMLDVITQAKIIRLLMKIQENTGISFIFITHDRELARVMCHETHDIGALSLPLSRVMIPPG